jgi:hypothetical protein
MSNAISKNQQMLTFRDRGSALCLDVLINSTNYKFKNIKIIYELKHSESAPDCLTKPLGSCHQANLSPKPEPSQLAPGPR